MAYETLEDFFGDIVGKARRGQGLSENDLASQVGMQTAQIGEIESYALIPSDSQIHALAGVLNLNAEKLIGVAHGWMPERPNDDFENAALRVGRLVLDAGMTVNCYVLHCLATQTAAVIDPGGEAERILASIRGLKVSHILLTHGHGDHVGALDAVAEATGAQVCGCARDLGLMGARSRWVTEQVDQGWETRVGNLAVGAVALSGHTPGGIGYVVPPVCFSGDALFAGSLGGARGASYTGQIDAVRRGILTLPDETRIFPGHGPITSVGQERAHNPYFI